MNGSAESADVAGVISAEEALRRLSLTLFPGSPPPVPPVSDEEVDRLIAECIRVAYHNLAGENETGMVHVRSLRSWVYRKTRAMLPNLWSDGNDPFTRVLSEGPGASLEFLGDLIRLPGGYFTAGPSRAVRLSENDVVLISSWPTAQLGLSGIIVESLGVTRRSRLTQADCERLNLPEQTPDSYAATYGLTTPRDYLENFVKGRLEYASLWTGWGGWEGYLGNIPTSYDLIWGQNPLECSLGIGRVSLWRSAPEIGQRMYRLRVSREDHVSSLEVSPQDSKALAVAIDAVAGRARRMLIASGGTASELRLNFPPPANLYRWLVAAGARWRGGAGAYIAWSVDTERADAITSPAKRMGIEVQRAGQ